VEQSTGTIVAYETVEILT